MREDMPENFEEDFTEVVEEPSSISSSSKKAKNPVKSVKETTGQTVKTTGNVIDKTGKGVQTAGKGVETAGKATEVAGKGAQVAGKGVQAAGKGMEAAGKGVDAAGTAAGAALSAIPVVGAPLGAVAKGAGKVAGTGAQVAGKGTQVAGKGVEAGGKAAEKAGKGMQKSGKSIQNTGKKVSDTGKKVSDTGDKIKGAGNKGLLNNNAASSKAEDLGQKGANLAKKGIKDGFDMARRHIKGKLNPASLSLKDRLKNLRDLLIFSIGGILVSILLIVLMVYMMFSPILEVIEWMGERWDTISVAAQKAGNMYTGFGCQTTKEAFFEELNYLYEEYDEQLDVPLLMATLFFKEREGYDTSFSGLAPAEVQDLEELDTSTLVKQATEFLKSRYKEVYETLDKDGKNYTIGKIYRLRKLARHQLDTSLFGDGGLPTEEEEISLEDFIERTKTRMSSDLYQAFEGAFGSANPFTFLKSIYDVMKLVEGEEKWDTTSFGNDNEATLGIKNLLKEMVMTGYSIGSLKWSNGGFVVTILKYDYNPENYRKYLKEYYVRHMPEFSEDIDGLIGEAKEQEIDKIIEEIYDYSRDFKEIYGYEEVKSGEEFDEECQGNIEEDLLSELEKPIKGDNYNFSGEDAYGISAGTSNNGVNLNESSASVKDGDDVFAIAKGKVEEVVSNLTCNTADDENCDSRGNYVVLSHEIKTSGSTYKIKSTYANLQANSGQPKKGKTVNKGDKIGKIGNTGDTSEPQVHFEIYDETAGRYLDPTNMFIPCTFSGSLQGEDDTEKIWFFLTKIAKYSKISSAAAMGNIFGESGYHPNNLEDGSNSKAKITDEEFTSRLNKGTINKSDFIESSTFGVYNKNWKPDTSANGIYYGYGLTQWTAPGRKKNFYEYWKKSNTVVEDLQMQLEFTRIELDGKWSNENHHKTWSTSSDLYDATIAYLRGFEVGWEGSKDTRYEEAKRVYEKYKDKKYASNISMDNLSSNSSSDERNQIVEYAKKFVGHPYVYGGTKLCENWKKESGCGVDCSGFIQNVFAHFGYTVGRDTNAQVKDGVEIKESELKPGDIIVYGESKSSTGHVAMYIGNKKIVHASNAKDGVKISDNYDYRKIASFRRIIDDSKSSNKSKKNSTSKTSDGTYKETKSKNKSDEEKLNYVFPGGVPKTKKEVEKYLVSIEVPITTKAGKKQKTTIKVNKYIAGDVQAALKAAQDEGFKVYDVSGYRTFNNGDNYGKVYIDGKEVLNQSQHNYGLAVDINVNENCYRPDNGACKTGTTSGTGPYAIKKSGALYKSFIGNGWGWGGNWSSSKDYMHFSYFGT